MVSRPATASMTLVLALVLVGCGRASSTAELRSDLPPGAVALVVPTAEPGVSPSSTDSLEHRATDAEIEATLAGISAAFGAADPEALRPWLADADSDFGRRWLERAAHLGALPLLDHQMALGIGLPDLTSPRTRAEHGLDANVRWIRERFRLDGFDAEPAGYDLFLTFVRGEGEAWLVVGDEDAEPLGLISDDHLWDQGPVVVTSRGGLAAIHHPGQPNVDEVLLDAERALVIAQQRWPIAFPPRVPVIIPATQQELGELLHVTFALDNFVAFATASVEGELGDFRFGGNRIVVNPSSFLNRTAATREQILVHEFLHVASRPVSGPQVPSWLDEGIAQAIGERSSSTGTTLLLDAARDPAFIGALPLDAEFTTGGRDRVFLSYQSAWSFIDHLARRFSVDDVARFYTAVGAGSIALPGTETYHVDRAAREVFGVPFADLRESWRAELAA